MTFELAWAGRVKLEAPRAGSAAVGLQLLAARPELLGL